MVKHPFGIPVFVDGGIRFSGDITKALDAGVRESHPHDVVIMRKTPNYSSNR